MNYTFAGVDRAAELERLTHLEGIFDPRTAQLVEAMALAPTARCLEIGAGAGSVARLFAARCGDAGEVVAVDLDTSYLPKALRGVKVIEGDVTRIPLPSAYFDIAHARYVLVHNSEWSKVLDTIVAALKPGGALVLEEPDFTIGRAAVGTGSAGFDRVTQGMCAFFRSAGKNPALGVILPSALEARGLYLERVDNHAPLCRGGDAIALMMARSTKQLRSKYLDSGLLEEEDLDCYQSFAADPSAWGIYFGTVSILARKPAD